MRVGEKDICAEDAVSGEGILSEYWWMTATVAKDSWISFRDKMSMEAKRPFSVTSEVTELSRGEVSTISGLLITEAHIACSGLRLVTTHSSMIGASEAQKLWDFSSPFLGACSMVIRVPGLCTRRGLGAGLARGEGAGHTGDCACASGAPLTSGLRGLTTKL